MNSESRSSHGVPILLGVFLTLVTVVAGQELRPDARMRRGTVQSELDYLRASKLPISIDLTQVTLRQAYDAIARNAEFSVSYEGALNGDWKRDFAFKDVPLKELLEKLGASYKLSYRVDGPDKLTVIGTKSK